jgi:hypothetical protein
MPALAPSLAGLHFRGNRDYLHSTDLYPALTEYAQKQFSPEAFVECLTIRQVATHQVRVELDQPEGSFGSFRVRYGTNENKGWLIETGTPISSRIPFDEVTAMREAISGQGFAVFNNLLPQYSEFELVIVLAKMIASQESTEHWWLCRIDLRRPLRRISPLECRLNRKVSNRYLTCNIHQAGQIIGSIHAITDPARNLSDTGSNP